MAILLKNLLKEDPDAVLLSYNDGKKTLLSWTEVYAYAFFTFPKYSLINSVISHGTHGDILLAIAHIKRTIYTDKQFEFAFPLDVARTMIKKVFEKNNIECSSIDEFIKDFTGGILHNFIKNYPSTWYINVVTLKDSPNCLVGRIWIEREIISFWNELDNIKKNWHEIKEMFLSNAALLGNLNKYQVDTLERDHEFYSYGVLPSMILAKNIEDNKEKSSLTPEEIRDLQKKLHTLSPGEKKKAMQKLGMIYNKTGGNKSDVRSPAEANFLKGAIAEDKRKIILLKDLLLQEAIVTANPNFKRWFKNSQVVNGSGLPLVVYHGTNQPLNAFEPERMGASTSNSTSKKGFFFTSDRQESSDYADLSAGRVISNVKDHEKKTAKLLRQIERAERMRNFDLAEKLTGELEDHELNATREGEVGANVLPVYLSIQNPKIVHVNGIFSVGEVSDVIDAAKQEGRDGVILIDIEDSPKGNIRSTHYIVFNPTQIKSALANRGTFDLNDPNITK